MVWLRLFFLAIISGISFMAQAAGERDEGAFISGDNTRVLDPTNKNDVNELANSIEFEVYKITENGSSRTIFESPAGICYGYTSKNGVDITNSTRTYLTPKDEEEYYGAIVGMTLNNRNGASNVQSVPVYVIKDPEQVKKALKLMSKNREKNIQLNIDKGKQILSTVVCK